MTTNNVGALRGGGACLMFLFSRRVMLADFPKISNVCLFRILLAKFESGVLIMSFLVGISCVIVSLLTYFRNCWNSCLVF